MQKHLPSYFDNIRAINPIISTIANIRATSKTILFTALIITVCMGLNIQKATATVIYDYSGSVGSLDGNVGGADIGDILSGFMEVTNPYVGGLLNVEDMLGFSLAVGNLFITTENGGLQDILILDKVMYMNVEDTTGGLWNIAILNYLTVDSLLQVQELSGSQAGTALANVSWTEAPVPAPEAVSLFLFVAGFAGLAMTKKRQSEYQVS